MIVWPTRTRACTHSFIHITFASCFICFFSQHPELILTFTYNPTLILNEEAVPFGDLPLGKPRVLACSQLFFYSLAKKFITQ